MILKITDKQGGFYYVDQIHRCSVRVLEDVTVDQILHQPDDFPRDSALIDPLSTSPMKHLHYRTFADGLARAYVVIFNVNAYLMDDKGKTVEKL